MDPRDKPEDDGLTRARERLVIPDSACGSRQALPLRLLRALVLHDRGGARHTPEAEAALRGEAALRW